MSARGQQAGRIVSGRFPRKAYAPLVVSTKEATGDLTRGGLVAPRPAVPVMMPPGLFVPKSSNPSRQGCPRPASSSAVPRRRSQAPSPQSGGNSMELPPQLPAKLTREALDSHQRQLGPLRLNENYGKETDLSKDCCELLWWRRKLDRSDMVQARVDGLEVPEKVNDTFIDAEEFQKAVNGARGVMRMAQQENRGSIRMGPDWGKAERLAASQAQTPEPGQAVSGQTREPVGSTTPRASGRPSSLGPSLGKKMISIDDRLKALVLMGDKSGGAPKRLGTGDTSRANPIVPGRPPPSYLGFRPGTGGSGRLLTGETRRSSFTLGDSNSRLGTADTQRSTWSTGFGRAPPTADAERLARAKGAGGRPPLMPPTVFE